MAEESYPVVEQPVSAAQWSTMAQSGGDGIIDRGNWPFWPGAVSSVSDTVEITPSRYKSKSGPTTGQQAGEAALSGFYYRMTSTTKLSIPPVSTPTTYWIALQYDPLRGSDPGGPIRLGVFKGNLDRSQGKTYLVLWSVPRNPNQTLQDAWNAGATQYRPRVSPQITVSTEAHLPVETETLVDTMAFVRDSGDEWRAETDGAGGIKWLRSANTRTAAFQHMPGWDLTGSATGGIVHQHTREGRTFLTAEVCLKRVAYDFRISTSWYNLGVILPPNTRAPGTSARIDALCRIGANQVLTQVQFDPVTGTVYARQITGDATIHTGDVLRFTLNWVR